MPFISASAITPYNAIRGGVLSGSDYDTDYQAVINYANNEGYTLPSNSQQVLQNKLVLDLKAEGVWSKLDSFNVFATDGDSDFALIDWKRLNAATAVNSPTFITNVGYQGDNSTAEIRTGYNPTGSENYKLNAASFGVFVNQIVTTGQYLAGGGGLVARMRTMGSSNNFINSLNISSPFNFGVVGLSHINRSSSTNVQCIINGVSTARTATSTSIAGEFVYLAYAAGVGNSNAKISIGFVGGDLSSEAAGFSTSVNNYISAL